MTLFLQWYHRYNRITTLGKLANFNKAKMALQETPDIYVIQLMKLAWVTFPNKELEYSKKLQQKLLDTILKDLFCCLTKIIYEYRTLQHRVTWSHLMDMMAIELAEGNVLEP